MRRLLLARSLPLAFATLSVLGTGCKSSASTTEVTLTDGVVAVMQGNTSLSTLVTGITASTTLDSTLNTSGAGFTVFAPVNSAFAALPAGVQDRLLLAGNNAILQRLLSYHVLPQKVLSTAFTEGELLTTVQGATVKITLAGGLKVNGHNITQVDIPAANGVIDLIDGVLTDQLDVVDVATLRGFSTFVAAAVSTGVQYELRGNGAGSGITVFVPTDTAFAALGALPTDTTLTNLLHYHIVAALDSAASFTNNEVLPTVEGEVLHTLVSGSALQVQGAKNTGTVTTTNIAAKNGIIHEVDGVLQP